MMIRNRVSAIAVCLALLLSSGTACAMGSDLAIQAGLARKNDQGAIVIYKNTTTIPFVPESADPDYYFGVAAAATSGHDLMCHAVVYLPQRNAVHGDGGDDVGDELISSVPYRVVTLADVDVPVCQTFLRLENDDLPGKYIVELFIGGKMAQKVVFDVQRK